MLLASGRGAGEREAAGLRAHLGGCAVCRAAAGNMALVLDSLASLARVRLDVDVTARVMREVRRAAPAPRHAFSRAALWIVGLAGAGLVAEGAWALWALMARRGATRSFQPLESAWAFLTDILELAARAYLFTLRIGGWISNLAGTAVERFEMVAPYFFMTAFASLTLLLLAALCLAHYRLRPYYGVIR